MVDEQSALVHGLVGGAPALLTRAALPDRQGRIQADIDTTRR
ncbi:hypothetical protein [Streptomyces cadmiisoli]|nr:hypothetical protein [Streptomyces cadmiisoli]